MQAVPEFTPATAIPISEQNKFYQDLLKLGYIIGSSSSTIGPGGYIYSAYLFYKEISFDERECRIAFYRADDADNFLLYSFLHPEYADSRFWNGFPFRCKAINWNKPESLWFSYPQDQATYQDLSLRGSWSDINQNGLPEFAVLYDFCPNACRGQIVSMHIYEIQTTSRVVDLTSNLPGAIEPFYFIHSKNPYTFYVYDPSLSSRYCLDCTYDIYWIYGWNGKELVDMTAQFQDEYLARGQEIIQNIRASYGNRMPEWELLEILFLYDKAGLRKQAIQDFLEISDPAHWPNSDAWEICWLQIARASSQEDYRLGKPFYFPPLNLIDLYFPGKQLAYALNHVDTTRYDVSTCQSLMATITPEP